jgi:hypothetical protein
MIKVVVVMMMMMMMMMINGKEELHLAVICL